MPVSWSAVAAAARRITRSRTTPPDDPYPGMSLLRLLGGELAWGVRQLASPPRLVAAVAVAVAVLAALGPATPGPVLVSGWRVAAAVVLGLAGAAVAHALLGRIAPRASGAGADPLAIAAVVTGTVALLVVATLLVSYLAAAVGGGFEGGVVDAEATRVSAALAIDRPIAIGAGLLVVGVAVSALGSKLQLPAALLLLVVGLAAGDGGFGLVGLADPDVVQGLAVAALVVIVFQGGLTTSPADLRRAAAPGVALATVGVLVSTAITAGAVVVLLDVPARAAWLIGAVVSSTDPAAVFALLRGTRLPPRLAAVLRVEAGTNDPVAVLLTVGLVATWEQPAGVASWLAFGTLQLLGGMAVGTALGWAGALVLRRVHLDDEGLAAVLALGIAGLAYGLAATVGGSGLLAAYLAGVVVAIATPDRREAVARSTSGLAAAVDVALFLLLGLLVSPGSLIAVAPTAAVVAVVLAFVARPVATGAALLPLGFHPRDVAVVAWLGLRGAVPIVLATFALSGGVPDAALLIDVVFFVVLLSTLLQGPTAPLAVRRLADPAPEGDRAPAPSPMTEETRTR